jgi:protein ImuB
MMRAVSLYLPFWPADRLRRQLGTMSAAPAAEKPLVFAGQEGSRRILVAANPAAPALGLCPGLACFRRRSPSRFSPANAAALAKIRRAIFRPLLIRSPTAEA